MRMHAIRLTNRHAGLVPASTRPHTNRPLLSRHGGPRNKSGVAEVWEVAA